MLYVTLALALLVLAQFLYDREERRGLLAHFASERQAWALERAKLIVGNEEERAAFRAERTELLNRIQAPEMGKWVHPNPDAPMLKSVGFDNDADYQESQRLWEAQMESSS